MKLSRKKIGLLVLSFPVWGFVLPAVIHGLLSFYEEGNTIVQISIALLKFSALVAVVSAIITVPVGILIYFWK